MITKNLKAVLLIAMSMAITLGGTSVYSANNGTDTEREAKKQQRLEIEKQIDALEKQMLGELEQAEIEEAQAQDFEQLASINRSLKTNPGYIAAGVSEGTAKVLRNSASNRRMSVRRLQYEINNLRRKLERLNSEY